MYAPYSEPEVPNVLRPDYADDPIPAPVEAQFVASPSVRWGVAGSVYDRIVQVIIYASVVLLPLFYLPWTTGLLEYNKQLLVLIVASVGVVAWLLGVVVSGKLSIRTSPMDKGVLAVFIASAIATAFSLDKGKSLFGFGYSLSDALLSVTVLTAFYFLVVNVIRDHGRTLRDALSVSLILALIVGLLQMFAWYVLPGSFTHSRAFNTIGSLNALGVLAAIALPMFAKATSSLFGRASAWFSVLGVAVSLVVLAILNWWVLWVVALASMLAMIAFDSLNLTRLAEDYGGRKRRFGLSRFIIPMVVIVIGAFLYVVGFNPTSIKGNFPIEIGPSFGLSWDVTKGVFSDRFLFGFGPENFSLAFDRFGVDALAQTQLAGAQMFDGMSQFLTTSVHGGTVAILALAFLLWCIVQVVARFGGAISESVARGESAGFAAQSSGTLAATVAMTVAYFLYPFNFALLFVWYVLLMLSALIIAGDRQRTVDIEEHPMWSLATSLGFIAALILVLTGVYFTSVRYIADARYADAMAMQDPDAAMTGFVSAINLNSDNDRYYRDASQLFLILLQQEINATDQDAERPQRIQNLIASAVQSAQRATELASGEAQNWANLGRIYQSLSGLVQDVELSAEAAFNRASELRPGDPTFDYAVGQMWLSRANLIASLTSGTVAERRALFDESLAKAETSFKAAIEKSPTYGLALYSLGAVYDRQNKIDEAIAQLEKLIPANPNLPTLIFELGLLYARDGRTADATAAMQRAVLLSPQYSNARWYLALLLEEQGNVTGALEQLRMILETNPDNETLTAKIVQLEAVPPVTAEGEAIDTEPLQ